MNFVGETDEPEAGRSGCDSLRWADLEDEEEEEAPLPMVGGETDLDEIFTQTDIHTKVIPCRRAFDVRLWTMRAGKNV